MGSVCGAYYCGICGRLKEGSGTMNSEYIIDLSQQVQELREAVEAIHPLIADIRELLEALTEQKRPKCNCECDACIDPGPKCEYYNK